MGFEDKDGKEEVFSHRLKAGKRKYFFDVRETRGGDFYITITELTKKNGQSDNPVFMRNKIFLYKEDMDTFRNGLDEVVGFIRQEKGEDYGAEGRVYDDDWNDSGN